MSATPPNLPTALAAVQAQLPDVGKDKTAQVETRGGGSYKYSYADLAKVTKKILPILAAHGLAWVTRPTLVDGRLILAYELLHTSGEKISGEYPLPDRGSPQEIGSAITYARRYALCSVTGVAPDDDDDAAQANAGHRPSRQDRAPRGGRPPAADGQAADGSDAVPAEPRRITDAQQRKLHALFREADIADREAGLTFCSQVVERDVESTKDLTAVEASKVIDRLAKFVAQQTPPAGGGTEAKP